MIIKNHLGRFLLIYEVETLDSEVKLYIPNNRYEYIFIRNINYSFRNELRITIIKGTVWSNTV